MITDERLRELALIALRREREQVDAEIARLRDDEASLMYSPSVKKRRSMSAAMRRYISLRMKQVWRKRRQLANA
jgi:hypothetical protein